MDPRFLRYYGTELQHLRELGAEFAKEFPKVAARLSLDGLECADPYVERLLECFAFLTARIQLRMDAEFPQFTQHLLEMVYPHYLAPTPSMAVVQFQPDLSEGSLAQGFVLPRNTLLQSPLGKGERTACEYLTGHEVTLWPIELVGGEYFTGSTGFVGLAGIEGAKAGLRLRLRATAATTFDKLALDRLPIFLPGGGDVAAQLYERLLANAVGVVVQAADRSRNWREVVERPQIRAVGFGDRDALLPYPPRSFDGYRLLQEYFAFPQRFLTVEVVGLERAIRRCAGTELEVVVALNRSDPHLETAVDASRFALFCSPAINVFPRESDRIHLTERDAEFHVLPDRTRPMDFEVYSVTGVVGYGTSADQKQEFRPFYAVKDRAPPGEHRAYFTVRRDCRLLSANQKKFGPRSSYVGSEVFVSLVDADEAPYRPDLRQLGVSTLCTNRDLPLRMPVGQGRTDFILRQSAPVAAIRCVAGPTAPKASRAEGETAWRLISHLTLNYLSLEDSGDRKGAEALRELLRLYCEDDAISGRQVEAIRSLTASAIFRRIPRPGPITFGRGLELTLTLDESGFGASGLFLLGAVLEQFFARYVSLNSFTETVVRTADRGEVIRWPARIGQRPII